MASNENSGTAGPAIPEEGEMCRICLETITNRSLTDTCNHPFCLECLRIWSEGHNICPLCRRVFRNILANYRSETDFQLIALPRQPEDPVIIPPDMIAINNLTNRLREAQLYNTFQEQHYINLVNRLNNFDPNSMEYLEQLQLISNIEDRIENNRQLIQQLRNDLRNAILQNINVQQNNNNQQNDRQNQNRNNGNDQLG